MTCACGNPAWLGGICIWCYEPKPPRKVRRVCSCGKKAEVRGHCCACYRKGLRNGAIAKIPQEMCPCGRVAKIRGLCLPHYDQYKKRETRKEGYYPRDIARVLPGYSCKVEFAGYVIEGTTWLEKAVVDDEEMVMVRLMTGWIPLHAKDVVITRSIGLST